MSYTLFDKGWFRGLPSTSSDMCWGVARWHWCVLLCCHSDATVYNTILVGRISWDVIVQLELDGAIALY